MSDETTASPAPQLARRSAARERADAGQDVAGSPDEIANLLGGRREPDTEQEQDAPDGATDELDEETDDVAQEETESGDGEDEDSPTSEQEPEDVVATLDELAENLDVDKDYLLGLQVDAKVNGEVMPVSLEDAIRSYQIGKAQDQAWKAVRAKEREIEQEATKRAEAQAQHLAYLETLANTAEQEVVQQQHDLESLRDDPEEYLRRQAEIAQRQQQLAGLKQQFGEAWNRFQAQQQELESQREQARIARERRRLIELIPEWVDETRAKQEHDEILKYASDKMAEWGYEPEGRFDAKDFVLWRALRDLESARTKVSQIKRKTKTLPRRSVPPRNGGPAKRKLNKIEARARKSGSTRDVAELLSARRTR